MNPIRSTNEHEAKLVKMHQVYCSLTGRDEAFMQFMREWFEFAQKYDQSTLENVLKFLIQRNARADKDMRTKIRLKRILDLQEFETFRADWALEQKEIASRKRQWQPTKGQQELAAMRNEDVKAPEQPAKKVSVALCIEALKKAVE